MSSIHAPCRWRTGRSSLWYDPCSFRTARARTSCGSMPRCSMVVFASWAPSPVKSPAGYHPTPNRENGLLVPSGSYRVAHQNQALAACRRAATEQPGGSRASGRQPGGRPGLGRGPGSDRGRSNEVISKARGSLAKHFEDALRGDCKAPWSSRPTAPPVSSRRRRARRAPFCHLSRRWVTQLRNAHDEPTRRVARSGNAAELR